VIGEFASNRLRKFAADLQTLIECVQYLRLDALEIAREIDELPQPEVHVPSAPTLDERIALATSVTGVWKALEAEFGVDRRTTYARVERVVLANGLHTKIPDWRTNVGLAKYLAGRATPNGERRLTLALRELDQDGAA